jgi:beta-glucosidase
MSLKRFAAPALASLAVVIATIAPALAQSTSATIRGVVKDDRLVATAKHWVGYGAAEGGRDYNTTDLSERALREIHFPPFRAAVDAGVGTLMSAFNDIDGTPASANTFTLSKVLHDEWRFDGFVVSDYTSVLELLKHGIAADEAEAARKALTAGVDMEMVSRLYAQHLPRRGGRRWCCW